MKKCKCLFFCCFVLLFFWLKHSLFICHSWTVRGVNLHPRGPEGRRKLLYGPSLGWGETGVAGGSCHVLSLAGGLEREPDHVRHRIIHVFLLSMISWELSAQPVPGKHLPEVFKSAGGINTNI